jgi:hypothetical protein
MYSLRRILPLVAVVMALCGAAVPSARGSMILGLQEAGVNGGAITTVTSAPSLTNASFSGTYGDFTVNFFGGVASQSPSSSQLLDSTTQVVNNSGTSKVLHMYVSSQDYTLPAGTTLNVQSGAGGTYIQGLGGLTFTAFADKNNALLGTSDYSNGLQIAVPPTGSGTTFDTGEAFGVFTRTANPYSLTTQTDVTLAGGASLNYSTHEVLMVPEPAGMALAIIGLGGWMTRARRAPVRQRTN